MLLLASSLPPIYVSSSSYICVLILLCVLILVHMCLIYVSSYSWDSNGCSYSLPRWYDICVLMLLRCIWHMCLIYVSSYSYTPTDAPTLFLASSYICVLFLLYMCPHAPEVYMTHVSDICVLILLILQLMLLLAPSLPLMYVSSCSYICVLILLRVLILVHMCLICVSSYSWYSNWCSYSLPRFLWYLCPHAPEVYMTHVSDICVLILLILQLMLLLSSSLIWYSSIRTHRSWGHMCTVSSYYYICVLCPPHTTTHVYCVLILLHMWHIGVWGHMYSSTHM
jgi:hypothetical protein